MTDTAGEARNQGERLLLWTFLTVFLTLLIRTAWVCDDAYITFRVVDNFVNGYGLRWNVEERVQAFTNPLWALVIACLYFFTRDAYYTSLVVSILLGFAAVLVLALRVALSPYHPLLAVAILTLSKAFVDYSTSGLENPLTHLLLVLFAWAYFRGEAGRRRLLRLALLAGLAGLNRLDTLALLLPPLLAAAWGLRYWRALGTLAIGFAPLLAWTGFSLFYYGFPLPNTAYAKLTTGIPANELAQQGLHYLFNSLSLDPITLVAILLGLILSVVGRIPGAGPLVLGIGLHLAYVVRVGGDFMSGRFLAAPLLMAVVLLCRWPATLTAPRFAVALVAVGAVGLYAPYPPLTTTAAFYAERAERRGLLDDRGITDERAIYYRGTGLLAASRAEPVPAHYMAQAGKKARADGETLVFRGAVGMFGFYAGPGTHVVDGNGLGDPLLARLPAGPGWRIGHFARGLPPGYEATLRKGGLRLEDENLAAYCKKLRLVTRGDLLDPRRLEAIWDLNFGPSRHLIEGYFRIHSRMQRVGLEEVSDLKAEGTVWNAGTQVFSDHGIEVRLGGRRHAGAIELSLDDNDGYKLLCLKEGYVLWEHAVPPKPVPQGGLSVRLVNVEPSVAAKGYDAIRLLPLSGDQRYSLGHLRLMEEPAPGAPRGAREGGTPMKTSGEGRASPTRSLTAPHEESGLGAARSARS